MRITLDTDGTITENPEFFSLLSRTVGKEVGRSTY